MAAALWKFLRADPRFEPTHALKDVLYRLLLREPGRVVAGSPNVRTLDAGDFVQWSSSTAPTSPS